MTGLTGVNEITPLDEEQWERLISWHRKCGKGIHVQGLQAAKQFSVCMDALIRDAGNATGALERISGGIPDMAKGEKMNVVSLNLCKQLQELGVFATYDTPFIWQQTTEGLWYVHETACFDWGSEAFPAPDLGYLMRKLPVQTVIKREYDASPEKPNETPAHYRALYDTADGRHFWVGAETPEDAACTLAIALFQSGILGGDT